MPAPVSDGELSDLDFTSTVVMHAPDANEAADPTGKVLKHLDAVVDSIALKIELGSTDERLWRILAAVYLATERAADYGDLVRRHLTAFGRPLELDQPPVMFSLPDKVNFDDIPKIDLIRSACTSPAGAIMDFSAVRRVSVGGLIALGELLAALSQVDSAPQMRGLEAFIGTVEAAIQGGQGTREMQDLVSACRRMRARHPADPNGATSAAA